MGLILTFLGLVAVAVLTRVLTDEFKAWTPWLVEQLIRIAVSNLDDQLRSRMSEEWRSHITETPGDLGKLIVACGFVRAAHQMGGKPVYGRILGAVMLVVYFPLLGFLF